MSKVNVNKNVFSCYVCWQRGTARMRTPLLLPAGRAAIDQYLPAVGPTAANPLWRPNGTDARRFHGPCFASLCGQCPVSRRGVWAECSSLYLRPLAPWVNLAQCLWCMSSATSQTSYSCSLRHCWLVRVTDPAEDRTLSMSWPGSVVTKTA